MIYQPEDILRFGKHRNKTIRQVYEDDPTYIRWCLDSIDTFEMSDKHRREALQVSSSYEQDKYADYYGVIDLYDFCD